MLTFMSLFLLCGWMLPADLMTIRFNFPLREKNQVIPLSMVKDSVDDMYSDCQEDMMTKVETTYFKKENKGIFQEVWKKASNCVKRNMQHKDKNDEDLTEEHFRAICIYTSNEKRFYELFNTAVRTNRSEYGTTFQFHSLHFWLTSAIQILNRHNQCHITYRRSGTEFTGKLNQMIRFGMFASSSYNPTLTHFGEKTCFQIQTCYGAYLKKYPHMKDKEEEVLIPPYEMFKIAEIQKKKNNGDLSDCETVYVLESIGFCSSLNCKAANVDQ